MRTENSNAPMPNSTYNISLISIYLFLLGLSMLGNSVAEEVSFSDIQPILQQNCVICHRGESAPLGLKLETLEQVLKGSVNGPVVVSNKPDSSKLFGRLTGRLLPRMPMTGPPFLKAKEIDLFKRWIAAGLKAGTQKTVDASDTPQPAKTLRDEEINFSHVAPIFATRCTKCHTDNGLMGAPPEGYKLTSYEATLSATDRLRVVPGKPAASELLRRLKGQALPRMPFDGPPYLSDDEVHLIEAWISNGAPDSNGQAAKIQAGARVRLHGRLIDGWLLDGLPLEITRSTRLQKNPGQGDYVRIRGTIDADGNVAVQRVRRR